jgi:proteasome lid subunit RPN8/RPN11
MDGKSVNEWAWPKEPVLRFSPTAWAKLLFFRDRGESEISGFGIAQADDLLRIEEFLTLKQEVTAVSISFDDQAVSDFFEAQVDAGRRPEQFARIWLHTHPGNSAEPSGTDEETFLRVFGRCQWAVMFILARGGNSYARLRFNVGPGGEIEIPAEVDYQLPFGPSAFEVWQAEYLANVRVNPIDRQFFGAEPFFKEDVRPGRTDSEDLLDELAGMDPEQRQLFLDELADMQASWKEEGEVIYE